MSALIELAYWQLFVLIGGVSYLSYDWARRRYNYHQEEVIEQTISYLIMKGYMKGYIDKNGVEHMLKLNESAPNQK